MVLRGCCERLYLGSDVRPVPQPVKESGDSAVTVDAIKGDKPSDMQQPVVASSVTTFVRNNLSKKLIENSPSKSDSSVPVSKDAGGQGATDSVTTFVRNTLSKRLIDSSSSKADSSVRTNDLSSAGAVVVKSADKPEADDEDKWFDPDDFHPSTDSSAVACTNALMCMFYEPLTFIPFLSLTQDIVSAANQASTTTAIDDKPHSVAKEPQKTTEADVVAVIQRNALSDDQYAKWRTPAHESILTRKVEAPNENVITYSQTASPGFSAVKTPMNEETEMGQPIQHKAPAHVQIFEFSSDAAEEDEPVRESPDSRSTSVPRNHENEVPRDERVHVPSQKAEERVVVMKHQVATIIRSPSPVSAIIRSPSPVSAIIRSPSPVSAIIRSPSPVSATSRKEDSTTTMINHVHHKEPPVEEKPAPAKAVSRESPIGSAEKAAEKIAVSVPAVVKPTSSTSPFKGHSVRAVSIDAMRRPPDASSHSVVESSVHSTMSFADSVHSKMSSRSVTTSQQDQSISSRLLSSPHKSPARSRSRSRRQDGPLLIIGSTPQPGNEKTAGPNDSSAETNQAVKNSNGASDRSTSIGPTSTQEKSSNQATTVPVSEHSKPVATVTPDRKSARQPAPQSPQSPDSSHSPTQRSKHDRQSKRPETANSPQLKTDEKKSHHSIPSSSSPAVTVNDDKIVKPEAVQTESKTVSTTTPSLTDELRAKFASKGSYSSQRKSEGPVRQRPSSGSDVDGGSAEEKLTMVKNLSGDATSSKPTEQSGLKAGRAESDSSRLSSQSVSATTSGPSNSAARSISASRSMSAGRAGSRNGGGVTAKYSLTLSPIPNNATVTYVAPSEKAGDDNSAPVNASSTVPNSSSPARPDLGRIATTEADDDAKVSSIQPISTVLGSPSVASSAAEVIQVPRPVSPVPNLGLRGVLPFNAAKSPSPEKSSSRTDSEPDGQSAWSPRNLASVLPLNKSPARPTHSRRHDAPQPIINKAGGKSTIPTLQLNLSPSRNGSHPDIAAISPQESGNGNGREEAQVASGDKLYSRSSSNQEIVPDSARTSDARKFSVEIVVPVDSTGLGLKIGEMRVRRSKGRQAVQARVTGFKDVPHNNGKLAGVQVNDEIIMIDGKIPQAPEELLSLLKTKYGTWFCSDMMM
jgi:hypothetical protein